MFALSPAEVVAQMFPKNQAAAASAYLNDSLQYSGSYGVSAATFHSQYLAAERWLAGQDAAGHLVEDIRVPTLVADGTLDQDIRPPNARPLANSVPGAKLLLFDGAGHAQRGSSQPSTPLQAEKLHRLRWCIKPGELQPSHSRDDAEQGVLCNPIAPDAHTMHDPLQGFNVARMLYV